MGTDFRAVIWHRGTSTNAMQGVNSSISKDISRTSSTNLGRLSELFSARDNCQTDHESLRLKVVGQPRSTGQQESCLSDDLTEAMERTGIALGGDSAGSEEQGARSTQTSYKHTFMLKSERENRCTRFRRA